MPDATKPEPSTKECFEDLVKDLETIVRELETGRLKSIIASAR